MVLFTNNHRFRIQQSLVKTLLIESAQHQQKILKVSKIHESRTRPLIWIKSGSKLLYWSGPQTSTKNLSIAQNDFLTYYFDRLKKHLNRESDVVYFDHRTHACACVRMVENDQKYKEMMKKYLFLHAHERLM